jgi:hypothetical protein
MITESVAVGTEAALQLEAVFQSVLVAPVQVCWADNPAPSRLSTAISKGSVRTIISPEILKTPHASLRRRQPEVPETTTRIEQRNRPAAPKGAGPCKKR